MIIRKKDDIEVDVFDFRMNEDSKNKIEIPDLKLITKLLESHNITNKEFGLCAEPFNMYYEICNTDKRGVSSYKKPLNTIFVEINENTTTRKKTTYYHHIQINYIDGLYYFICLAQNSFYKKNISGVENKLYKIKVSDITETLDEIMKGVESI